MFAVVDAVLLQGLPYHNPERLLWITSVRSDSQNAPFSLPEFLDYREQARTLSGIAAYANWSASIARDDGTERLQGARMSANSFEVLGVSAATGRLLRESDDRAEAPRVAILSYRLWQREFGGSSGVVGSSLRINGESFEVVGVLPRHFPLPLREIDVVVPLAPDRDPLRHVRSSVNFLRLFGRVTEGATVQRVQQELNGICHSLRQQFPSEYARKSGVRTIALHEILVGDYRQVMLFLLGAVIVVLATALANLLSLVLARTNDRRSELTIRLALGGSRFRLIRQLSVEALLLTCAGAGVGLALGMWLTRAALPWLPASIPRIGEIGLDKYVLLFTVALTVAVAILLSVAPVGSVAAVRAADTLRLASRGALGDRWQQYVRNALVVGEIATALVLLLATAGLVQAVLRLQRAPLGFRPDSVFQARISLPPSYNSREDLTRFYERLSEGLTQAPGVQSVGVISVAPLSGLLATVGFSVAGQPLNERDLPSANLRAISADYLSAVGTRLTSGRRFVETDTANNPPIALVSAALAERFLADDWNGRQLLIDDNSSGARPVEIVGVVEDVRHTALDAPPSYDVYIPLRQVHPDGVPILRNNQFWMVRTTTAPSTFRETFLTHLRRVDRDVAISDTGTMRQYVEAWLGPRRFSLALLVSFSVAAASLAIFGVYGLVSYAVSRRKQEIGLRMAVGATERDVRRLILGQASRLAVVGSSVGLVAAGAARPLTTQIAQDLSLGPMSVLVTTAILIGVVISAAWVPARRATLVDPVSTLRSE
jgi:putative ABC transport system permease protein